MDVVNAIEQEQIKEGIPEFKAGDTVKIHYRIVEGQNQRVQVFEGVCIALKNSGVRRSFTVRKISYGVGVERVFPMYSPRIEKIEVTRRGRVRRAKLYYLRSRIGKAAKVPELIRKKK